MQLFARYGTAGEDISVVYIQLFFQIADFGMSRNLQDEAYYTSNNKKIPVKWTAPEVFSLLVFYPVLHRGLFLFCSGYLLPQVLYTE